MKLLLFTLAVTFALAFSVAAQRRGVSAKPLNWTNFTSNEGGFSVKFPGTPVTREEAVPGSPARTKHIVEVNLDRGRHFEVSWVDHTGSQQNAEQLKDNTLNAVASSATAKGARPQYSTGLNRAECDGQEVSLQAFKTPTQNELRVQARTFNSGDRVFLVLFSSNVPFTVEPGLAEQFLDTFTIAGVCKPKWIDYTFAEGGFTLKLPNQPRTYTEPVAPQHPEELRSLIEVENYGGRHYEVTYENYLGGLDSVELARTDAFNQLIGYYQAKGELVGRDNISRGKCRGEQATLRIRHPVTQVPVLLKARIFSSYKTIYSIYFAGRSDSAAEGTIADEFLNSFNLTGDCQTTSAAKPLVPDVVRQVPGVLDQETGWHQIDSPYGVRFLVPALPMLETGKITTAPGDRFHHLYLEANADHNYTIDVIDVTPGDPVKSASQQTDFLLKNDEPIRTEMAMYAWKVDAGKPITNGTVPGREYALTNLRTGAVGFARMYITTTKLFRVIAFAQDTPAGKEKLQRFLDSIKIDPK